MFDKYPEILSFKDVCKILNVSRPTLMRYLNSGELKGIKLGNKRLWKICKEDLINFVKNNSGKNQ